MRALAVLIRKAIMIDQSSFNYKLLALSFIDGVGRNKLMTLVRSRVDFNQSLDDLVKLVCKDQNPDITVIRRQTDEQFLLNEKYCGEIISVLDPRYPKSLIHLPDAPATLFCRGNINLLSTNSVGVIGTRSPTEHGEILNRKVTKWLTTKNFTIVSGLALGHDTIAHDECLNNNGSTIAVLAHGLDTIYPKKNTDLFNRILDKNGLLLSEYPYLTPLYKQSLVQRDRIQAGLSKAIFLVQSSTTGGSLHASRSIMKYNRYLVVLNQSKTDISKNSENISANLALINDDTNTIKSMFDNKFHPDFLIKLRSSEDFTILEKKLLENPPDKNPNLELLI